MAESKELGVVDHRCEAFGNEGLFCIDSSAIPTSLGVNPSLTIAAVSERAANALIARSEELGLPAGPGGSRANGSSGGDQGEGGVDPGFVEHERSPSFTG
jgi:cholesterol oxidase